MKKYIFLDHGTGEFDVYTHISELEKRCEQLLEWGSDLDDFDFVVARSLDIDVTKVVKECVTMKEQKLKTVAVPRLKVEGELESPDSN